MEAEYTQELKKLLDIAKHPRTQSLLRGALAEVETVAEEPSKSQTEQSAPKQSTPEQAQAAAIPAVNGVSGKVVVKPSKNLIRITNYGWDQSEKFVKIYIHDMGGAKNENIHAQFDTRDIKVEILDVSGKNYTFSINNLCGDIVPDQSSAKAKSGMVILSLRTKKSDKWQFLTAREKKLKDIKDQKAKLTDEDKEDPSKSIMNLMKQMYQDGDAEMKRTIAKSWTEAQEKRMRGSEDFDF